MYHKCNVSFLYKPKDILASEESFFSALSSFLALNGYQMCSVDTDDKEKMFTIEPLPEIIKKKVVIPTKK